ncbi:MAG: FliH/SctL family protein [Pirellulales bacterium]|jgi:flagellar assembly protein FliH|nr:FliH/SctL family protein [Thermoguttaceae bacterium]MDD4786241.1 FliH/SctL family protein [Pirellulales bacterium]MDI9443638.1 FliH/SctL family protein [Planctomycetota bacterium]NLZ02890.1 hypothetical protein [Pirellulaceae bacterium]
MPTNRPTVIKATDRAGGIQPVAFNFDDMAEKAGVYLDGVRQQAGEVLTRAQQDAERIRRATEEESRKRGYADGQREIQRIVGTQLAEQLATLMPALAAVIDEIQQAKETWLAHWERSAVRLAIAIAERIVRKQVEQHPEIPLQLVGETLRLVAGSPTVRVRLNPQDYDALQPQAEALVRAMAGLGACELAADPAVTRGGCRVETAFGEIDQAIETQMRRIEEELT